MRILIIDDEPDIVAQIRHALASQGYTVDTAFDGIEALDRIYVDPYDLILLDIMLPQKDGFEVLSELRKARKSTPVLMLTARGTLDDRIKGLDLGADDYLAKPFSMEELLARIRALLRRSSTSSVPVLQTGDIAMDTAARSVYKNERPLDLTPKEFSIFEFLLYNTNRAVSRYTIAEHVWGDEFDPITMSNSIDVHVKNLRKKIGDHRGAVIRTVRGIGYMIKDDSP